jgi:hypothetical protein
MPDKPQFTLKWLLVEMALVAVVLAVLRWLFFTDHRDDTELELDFMLHVGAPLVLACAGAAIGGVLGKMKVGAICGLVIFILGMFVQFPFQL